MIKTFLSLISLQMLLFASQQYILVVAPDFNTSHAKMIYYDGSTKASNIIDVNIGKRGLGWGLGIEEFQINSQDPHKKEGDKKAPAGVFELSFIFEDKNKSNINNSNNFKHIKTTERLICVDDSSSPFYNQVINMPKVKPSSFETMIREDQQYVLGISVDHNKQAKALGGSCIFMHVEKSDGGATAGCTSMKYKELVKLSEWLDPKKRPLLIQIPKSSLEEVKKRYPDLKDAEF